MCDAPIVGNRVASFASLLQGTFTDNGLAVTTRNIKDIGWLTQSGNTPAQAGHELLPLSYREAEVTGPWRKVRVV